MDTLNKPYSFEDLNGATVYIDTNVFIYFLDGRKPFVSMVSPFLESVLNGDIVGFTGQAVIAETLVQPYKLENDFLVERFKAFFYQPDFLTLLDHDAACFELAAKISGKKGMKLVDSLHFATALQAGCQYLITHDKGMKSVEGIEIFRLDQL